MNSGNDPAVGLGDMDVPADLGHRSESRSLRSPAG